MTDYRFTFDWFTGHLDQWRDFLADWSGGPNLRFVEIGCLEGRATTWLLENVLTDASSTIHCIDPWHYPGDWEARFDANVALARRRGGAEVVKHKAFSADVLPGLDAESMDLVYVDGSHTAWDTLTDVVLSWRLVRPGGFMVCDDYPLETGIAFGDDGEITFPPTTPVEQPKMAIDAFRRCFEGRYRLRHEGWQVWLEKTV